MTISYQQLRDANPAMFHQSAAAWKDWADAALVHAGYVDDRVNPHIQPGHWDGMVAELARGKVTDAKSRLTDSAGRLKTIETVLVQAGQDFEQAQQDLLEAVREAQDTWHFEVDGDGHITIPGPLIDPKTKDKDTITKTKNAAATLQTKISAALYRADQADKGVNNALNGLFPPKGGSPTGGAGPTGGHGPSGWNGDYGPSGGPPLQKPSGNVAEWIRQAIAVLHQHGINLGPNDASYIATIIQYESGGNPHAINLWDSNAAAGHPSKGLMQTIDGTFNSYAMRQAGGAAPNVWNPVDNIVAGVNYALHRYGSLANVPGIRNLIHHTGGYVGY
ncbi:transglycosylase SLT domain-containing protein [Actinoallomurus soli]|uniref:transglycosylase SLT domain-containing protein n=1 Tax=Actinoallomurus soli TaxID=2952535 RepID=UPI00209207C1|nr:transglycosylase SLT domain-containing protein [Actinoallomurus soli]MCO5968731.1 transglycosylase SLT domain-containing protein [Actinoallomurus soli]